MSPERSFVNYRITAKLGQVGMGEVWRATDTKVGGKLRSTFSRVFASDPERIARLNREAEVLAALNHPNIAQVYGRDEGALVMELVKGERLKGPKRICEPVHEALSARRICT